MKIVPDSYANDVEPRRTSLATKGSINCDFMLQLQIISHSGGTSYAGGNFIPADIFFVYFLSEHFVQLLFGLQIRFYLLYLSIRCLTSPRFGVFYVNNVVLKQNLILSWTFKKSFAINIQLEQHLIQLHQNCKVKVPNW